MEVNNKKSNALKGIILLTLLSSITYNKTKASVVDENKKFDYYKKIENLLGITYLKRKTKKKLEQAVKIGSIFFCGAIFSRIIAPPRKLISPFWPIRIITNTATLAAVPVISILSIYLYDKYYRNGTILKRIDQTKTQIFDHVTDKINAFKKNVNNRFNNVDSGQNRIQKTIGTINQTTKENNSLLKKHCSDKTNYNTGREN